MEVKLLESLNDSQRRAYDWLRAESTRTKHNRVFFKPRKIHPNTLEALERRNLIWMLPDREHVWVAHDTLDMMKIRLMRTERKYVYWLGKCPNCDGKNLEIRKNIRARCLTCKWQELDFPEA